MPLDKKGKKVSPEDALKDLGEDQEEDDLDEEEEEESSFIVETPSGASLHLMNKLEVEQYEGLSKRYQEDNMFKNISDLLELDRILTMEIMCLRWGAWMLSEKDYHGEPVNTSDLQKQHREYGKMILELKQGLNLDKKSRDANNAGTVADFIENLKVRAKEFGVHRDEQNYMAYNLLRELESKITLMNNATETERTEFEVHAKQVLQWFIDEVVPKLDKIDEHFRENQKIWVRDEFND